MKKILVVDDEAGMRESLSVLLESEGYDVVVAEDGFIALALFKENRFDLILTDITMPGLTGLRLSERIRRDFPELKVVIIAMSGYSGAGAAASLFGCDAFIVKPVDNSELIKIVKKLLEE